MGITTLPLDAILSSTEHELFSQRRALLDVSTAVAKSKRAVVISGAGISCSSGIPDFRSADGLYSLVKARYPDTFFTGKDLFSSGLFNAPETTALFYTFIGELAASCGKAEPTRTHHFIQRLHHKGKLLRSYTQNIDGLERRVGLESGGRGTGLKKMTTKNVEMHGDLGRVRCVLCMADFEARVEWMEMFREGCAPWCPACEDRNESRIRRSAREVTVGSLRPSIVLYDEPHPHGEEIGNLQAYDLKRSPDLLLVMGTSLKVHGLKIVVREFAKAVHARKGLVVFVNLTPPSKEWEGIIDIHVAGETDAWVDKVEADWKHIRPADWEIQTRLEGEVVKDVSAAGKAGSKARAKGKSKAKKPEPAEPLQLPTPRPSQSPHRPKDSSTFTFDGYDDALSPVPTSAAAPSSPLSPPPSSPLPSVALLSPSKRRADVPPSPVSDSYRSPSKKRVTQVPRSTSGLAVIPGHGNLFASPNKVNDLSNDDEWSDEICAAHRTPLDVFGSPVKPKGRARKPTQKAIENKENVKPRAVRGTRVTPTVVGKKRATNTATTKARAAVAV